MAISRGDTDTSQLNLADPEAMEPLEKEARVYVADVAIKEGWQKDELLEHLRALGLAEANLDPARGTRHRRYPKKREKK